MREGLALKRAGEDSAEEPLRFRSARMFRRRREASCSSDSSPAIMDGFVLRASECKLFKWPF